MSVYSVTENELESVTKFLSKLWWNSWVFN